MKVKAVYRDPKANPFELRLSTVISAEVLDGTPKEKLEKWAKEATPKGLEFVDVVMEDGSPIK